MLTFDRLRMLLNAQPFVPFRIWLSDGGHVDVPTRELVMALRQCAIVGLLDPNAADGSKDWWTTVWYLHVSRVEMLAPGAPPFSSPPPESGNMPSPATV
jgi:hypothetical protein